jgi:Kef-type K+ transport system membrane component KefB
MWVLTLVAALGVMVVLQRFTRAAPVDARAALALAFLILAAHVCGEIARQLKLPRITGFILAGLVAGPAWFGLVRADEIEALRFISTAALALLALAAGVELRWAALRTAGRALGRVTVGVVALPFLAVTLVVLSVTPWFPITANQPFVDSLTVALFLGAVAAVSTPLLAEALITERGVGAEPFPQTVLRVSILQDFAAFALICLLLVVMQLIASPGSVSPGVAGVTLVRLAGSLGAGFVLGTALAQYLAVIRRHTTLVLIGAAFIVAQCSRMLGLEPTLAALAAGVTMANLWPAHGERVRADLRAGAIPLYTVFFALLGCALDVGALRELWPWVLLLAGLRITAVRAGWRWAGVSPALERWGWLAFVSQSGFAVTLAAIARQAFPEWGISLESIILAMIGVHAVAGPVCFQKALHLINEVPEVTHERISSVAGTVRSGAPIGMQ